jgi:hypothetical protein
MTDTKITKEHVELFSNIMTKLKQNPRLIDSLHPDEVNNLSKFSHKFHYSLAPIKQKPRCVSYYHKFQELGSKYNLRNFINCELSKPGM